MIRLALLLWFALWLLPLAAGAQTSQTVEIGVSVVFAAQTTAPNILFQYREPDATQCQYTAEAIVKLNPSAVNVAVNYADIFPVGSKPIVIGCSGISTPAQPFDVGLESSGARIHINGDGYLVSRVDGTAPILFFDNPSGSQACYVQIFGLSGP